MAAHVASPFGSSVEDGHFTPPTALMSSSSVKSLSRTSAIIPYLRRLDIRDDTVAPKHPKLPLLTLKASTASFLEAKFHDGLSRDPLYSIETLDRSTTISRCDAWEGLQRMSDIRWPKQSVTLSAKGKERDEQLNTLVQLPGKKWKSADKILKHSAITGTWSFSVPGITGAFRWKRVGTSFICTTTSIKGPVATFDPAVAAVPPRICVYEPMIDKRASTKAQTSLEEEQAHGRGGVSIPLLDYLVVTSLLLVTSKDEYSHLVPLPTSGRREGSLGASPNTATVASFEGMTPPSSGPMSTKQWRKIVYGEPLFPAQKAESIRPPKKLSDEPCNLADDDIEGDGKSMKRPASVRQWRKIAFGEPLYHKGDQPRDSVFDDDDSFSDEEYYYDEEEEDEEDEEEAELSASDGDESDLFPYPMTPISNAPLSNVPEQFPYPATPVSMAPGHSEVDPSFYADAVGPNVPPVPELPTAYQIYGSSSGTSISDVQGRHSSRYADHSSQPGQRLPRSRSSPSMNGFPAPPIPPSAYRQSSSSQPGTSTHTLDSNSERGSLNSQPDSPYGTNTSGSHRYLPMPPIPGLVSQPIQKRRSLSMSAPAQRRRPQAQRSLPPTPQAGSTEHARAQEYLARTLQKEVQERRRENSAPVIVRDDDLIMDVPPPAYHAIDFSAPPGGPSTASTSALMR